MDYQILPYAPEFRDKVLELQTHLWSPDAKVNSAYLKWKYEQNPYLETPLITMALAEGKVIGMRGMYGAKWRMGSPGQTRTILVGGDLVIAPDHRKRGLVKRINTAAIARLSDLGHDYVLNFSATPATFFSSINSGWRSVGPYRMAARGPGEVSPELQTRVRQAERHVSIKKIPKPTNMEELVVRAGRHGPMQHVRDRRYYAWRFQNPLCVYRFLFWQDRGLEGFLVLRTARYNRAKVTQIVEWEATRSSVFEDLLFTALHHNRSHATAIWTAAMPSRAMRALRNAGFRRVDESSGVENYQPGVLVRAVDDEVPADRWAMAGLPLLDNANWNLRMIYSDTF